jgi:hypothetical protein
MIKRHSICSASWGGESEIILEELRARGAFERGFGGEESNKTDASPYWYGTILNFKTLDSVMPKIKKERLERIAESYIDNLNSPIVRLLGFTLQRKAKETLAK